MSNIATMISQSRKLIELGLDETTADMYYPYLGAGQYGDTPRVGFPIEYSGGRDIPAWSLPALLKQMERFDPVLIYDEGHCFCRCDEVESEYFDDPVTAAYDVLCWLLEQGFIKKGDTDED